MTNTDLEAARWLLTPGAIRTQCNTVLAVVEAGRSAHFSYHPAALGGVVDHVVQTMADCYPQGDIPYHARWRHFRFVGEDRWAALAGDLPVGSLERARAAIDLAVVSVLLDAGAGDDWRYRDARSGTVLSRSEGLAIASLDAFAGGLFSDHAGEPLRCDASRLVRLREADIAGAFQAGTGNPLAGLQGRVALMNRLGESVAAQSGYFGEPSRIGHLADFFASLAVEGDLAAEKILVTLLDAFSAVWPGRLELAGLGLGDTWRHPAATGRGDASDGLVPFHKLSQWLAYSLVEPLHDLGLNVTGLDQLTGLAEYRNGGLMVDGGLIRLKDEAAAAIAQAPDSELIVEWRALTVALLDRVADAVRETLGRTADELPLASVLEGGTWQAGRRLAAKRSGGGPPIAIISDGSVF